MKIKISLLTLLTTAVAAMMTVAAVGATSASAAEAKPHYKMCVKVKAGEPSSWKAGCKEKETGGGYAKVVPPAVEVAPKMWCAKVEEGEPSSWLAGCKTAGAGYIIFESEAKNPNAFTSRGTEKEVALLETKAKRTVECENTTAGKYTVTDEGEFTGPRSSTDTVTFTGKCHSTTFGGGECHSINPSAAEGTIVTRALVDKPVYLTEAESSAHVGDELSPATAGGLFAEFECKTLLGGETVKVGVNKAKEEKGEANGKDSIVCPVTPVNEMVTKFTLTCVKKGTEAGIQEFTVYWEGKASHPDYLETEGKGPETFTWEQSDQKTSATIFTTELGEIKA